MRRLSTLSVLVVALVGIITACLEPLQAASPIWAPSKLEEIIDEGLTQNKEIRITV